MVPEVVMGFVPVSTISPETVDRPTLVTVPEAEPLEIALITPAAFTVILVLV
jgi:hypothetical protein